MRIVRFLLAALIALAATAPVQSAHAQAPYTQAELDQMLAPIALYPDALLSQILLAATRPLEVVEAARWSRANPELQGDEAVQAVQREYWDPSVKSLVAFPQLLARMDEKLEWTKVLGDAFFVQEPVVMETIQELRRRARAAGHLLPDDRLRVREDGQAIVIEPAVPQMLYVPYYDPWVVYGPWWWSAYPPIAWTPWPGYVVRRPGGPAGFWWGPGSGVSIRFMIGSVDWFHRRVRVPVHPGYSRPVTIHRDPPLPRRIAPDSVAPEPRIEPRAPRAERPYPRRDFRPDAAAPEARRIEPRAGPVVDPAPRFTQRAPQTQQPAPATPVAPVRVERPLRTEVPRVQRAPQTQPAQSQAQRIERAPQPQPQPPQSQVQRIERAPQPQPPHAKASRFQAPQALPPRGEPAPKAAPARTEPASRKNGREAHDAPPRGGVRP